MITPKTANLGYSNLWTDMSTILGYASNFQKLITKLFSNGEQGFFYDPNDLSTMWQDQAKLLPVTGEGQPVWHILDKSGNNNHAFATSSATRPILQRNATTGAYYLAFDGANDFLQTNNIDFTATDKVSLFAGVRKLSDATTAVLCEFSNNSASTNGTFALFAPTTPNAQYQFRSKGTSASVYASSPTNAYPAPHSTVLTGFGSPPQNIARLRVNGIQVANTPTAQGSSVYGNHPLYIGRRGGTSLPFNGHLYSLIGIGRLTTDSETVALEKSIAKNVGVTLNV